ncbi:hypothetical protein [Peterkaempfera griseoplana]|uniref:hypothetical protein n=1 Tax=Peterkaempfera griseoplana TaxID=66896 RepID=UPI0006E355C7|nr:hypothetical protein [Peterkaempfera griseoplana]
MCPLPDGEVTGTQQVARRGDVVVIAALTPTIREDTWSGVRISIVSPTAGEIASNWFSFSEHAVFDDSHLPRNARDGGDLTRYNQQNLLRVDRIRADRLRDAVNVYTAAFAPPPAPEFAAAAQLEGLWRLAATLNHLGSIDPTALAGRAFVHAEALREIAGEIHPDLSAISGERSAADSGQITLNGGLDNLRELRTSLTELSARLNQSAQAERAARFRQYAEDLGGIDAEITAALPQPNTAKTGTEGRVAAARSTPSTRACPSPAPSHIAGVPALSGSAPARGTRRGQR